MNSELLKDKTWLIMQGLAILSGIIGIIMSVNGSNYWILFAVLTLVFIFLAMYRVIKRKKE